ncbi:type I restriction modification DNA specificity domain protein [Haemophilus pittmaniae HK 85]|uniref:Type I restriction modification DNA specificity domain protein n=1 Tax=Haemophilus pittmaniae HK 85 TaxID=1035188 RepID=F9QC47_9PAST|nr:type I restriction modification DNA specificity domain protein [Haemophilus pittmaniae HK 85]
MDALTALTSELTSELILRRKQYEYYREKLLSFDSLEQLNMGGAKKKLIDVAIYAKVRILADKLDKENYVGVENLLQNKLGKTSSNYVPTDGAFIEYLPNDILIGNIRPYLRKIWLSDRKGGTNGDVLVIRLTDENILPRYLYHILANEHFFEYNVKYSKGAKMPRGDKAAILQYEFDVPTFEQQQRIISILDKFETLTNSITEGLPLAIEQSQKRYEYYRELLLNFS